jgi:uncharacterized protein YaiL (DUF2058 family)
MSLQEQLKKSGLVDEKKAKQLKRAKLKEEKLVRKNQVSSSEELQLALQRKKDLQLEKQAQANKDRQLNQDRNVAAQSNALKAQIKQLVESNRVKPDGDKKYGYVDAGKIKNLWVNQQQLDQLSRGVLCIVSHSSNAALVPRVIAEKIEQRDPAAVLHKVDTNGESLEDDPYAKYEIPDDLDW